MILAFFTPKRPRSLQAGR